MNPHGPDRPSIPPQAANELPKQTEPQNPSRRRHLPAYKVILLYEKHHDLMFVVRTVMEVIRFCRAEATHKMWQAHHQGRSVLLITYLERAELYAEQFASHGLPIALEPAS